MNRSVDALASSPAEKIVDLHPLFLAVDSYRARYCDVLTQQGIGVVSARINAKTKEPEILVRVDTQNPAALGLPRGIYEFKDEQHPTGLRYPIVYVFDDAVRPRF